ncbi:DNA polymerase delta subunit 3-like [Sinocyclocheilus anshuiensis]|uniref:DNA polymerase delta subunit 3-like n=1 Tax=Sinocyclocheilus anshuiensis TaxID=1608454 RepID=UPI0007B8CBC4|nr:PREDICTED: DNA polymerase delta subunit 3-like [Sinocyclocheilus anshuiensis]
MDDLYLDNIDEFVNDQNKIVTYKWLSLTLGVHVNTAKQMLYHYLQQKRNESSGTPLHATYLVSGKCVENGSTCHKVSVVREDKLDVSVFLVTEKGYVSESYSENEEEPEPNSQAKDSSSLKQSFGKREEEKKVKSQKKTSTANKPTKQPSIMGFFQKK